MFLVLITQNWVVRALLRFNIQIGVQCAKSSNHRLKLTHGNATQFIYFYINSVFKRKQWQKTAFLLPLHHNPSSGLHCCNFSFFYWHSLSGCYIISNKSKGVYSSSLLNFSCGLLSKIYEFQKSKRYSTTGDKHKTC